jgi:hypothetical protein
MRSPVLAASSIARAATGVRIARSAASDRSRTAFTLRRASSFFFFISPLSDGDGLVVDQRAHAGEGVQRLEDDRMVAAEGIAVVEDPHQHGDDAAVAQRDQRFDDRAALLAGGRAQDGVHRARSGRIVDLRQGAHPPPT